ncbi:MAG: hypothetical protein FJ318_01970 [SAR202 cluster bacterium]|nr:hypothetical protein [SAR202 cluster bacterium]
MTVTRNLPAARALDASDAMRWARLVIGSLGLKPGALVLGFGDPGDAHLQALASLGMDVTVQPADTPYFESIADVRLTIGCRIEAATDGSYDGRFDAVVSVAPSFGGMGAAGAQRLLTAMSNALRGGAKLFLDLPNPGGRAGSGEAACDRATMVGMLREAAFVFEGAHGDAGGAGYHESTSPRLMLIGRKPDGC